MGKNYPTYSPEERKEKMTEIFQNLEDGVKSVFTSENYLKYLEVFSRFHNYSFSNTILILMQRPDASYVASLKDWNTKFNRVVKKGEHGITILVPTPKKVIVETKTTLADGTTEVSQTEKKRMYFKRGTVFDISQTVGDELPSIAKNLDYETPELNELIIRLINSSPIPILYDMNLKENDANGYYYLEKNEIYLKSQLKALHKLKTIIHESSHYEQETKYAAQTKELDRSTKEVIAESTAFCVIKMLSNEFNYPELSSSEYSFGYIASWGSKDLKELKQTLSLISEISNSLFNWISKQFNIA